jgi:DNA-binding GntR family transcriptional regulator
MPKVKSNSTATAIAPKREHGTSVVSALKQVRELIVHGKLSPGTWILEEELAKRLHLSRTPTRAALQWLQQEGYIREHRTATRARMIVAPLTKEDAKELYSVIGRLEGLAGRITAALPKSERMVVVNQLKSLNQQLAEVKLDANKHGEIFDLDRNFHRLVVESGAGPRLQSWHQTVEPQVERYWRLYANSMLINFQFSINEHNDIIRALVAGDADQVEHSLQVNWENGCERLGHIIDIFGERGLEIPRQSDAKKTADSVSLWRGDRCVLSQSWYSGSFVVRRDRDRPRWPRHGSSAIQILFNMLPAEPTTSRTIRSPLASTWPKEKSSAMK